MPMAKESALVPSMVNITSPFQSFPLYSFLTLELPLLLELLAPGSFHALGGIMLGLDLQQSECVRMSSMVGSGSLLMNIPCFFNCSFRSLKSANSTFGLFGGDLGEAEGVFLHVDWSDIIAEEMGDTRAEERAEYSRWASFNILM